jgi:Domain of unknown function (DUF4203)
VTVPTELYPWISIGAIAWGLLDCFFGYRVFKVTLALLGGLLGGFLGQSFALAMSFGPGGQIAATVICGLLGAGLAFMLYVGAVFVAGFGFGSTLGILLLAHYNQMVALLTGCVMGVIGGFLAVKLQQVLIILATALLGSFRTILAVSYFSSRLDWIFYFKNPQQLPAVIDGNGWMFPAILVLAVVGVIVQFELGGSGAKKKSKARDK